MSQTLDRLASGAGRLSPADLTQRLDGADRIFNEINDECVKSAKAPPI